MTNVQKRKNFIINIVFAVIVCGMFYLFFRYALWVCMPFLFAAFIAMILQRPVNAIVKRTPIKRGLASTITVAFFVLVILGIVGALLYKIVSELSGFFSYVAMLFEDLPKLVADTDSWIRGTFTFLPEHTLESVAVGVTDFMEKLFGLAEAGAESGAPSFDFSVLASPLGAVWGTAKQIPTMAVATLIAFVSCFFMTADYKSLCNMILKPFPAPQREVLRKTKRVTLATMWKMAKAYGIIMLITFTEIAVSLTLLKLFGIYKGEYILAIAIVTAIVDIIPVLGTGTVLIPWGAVTLIMGDVKFAISIWVVYALITIIRQVLEPKLVAEQAGLPAFVTIMAMYLGTKLFGVLGLFILPMTLMIVKALNDEGVIHLFRSDDEENPEPEAAVVTVPQTPEDVQTQDGEETHD